MLLLASGMAIRQPYFAGALVTPVIRFARVVHSVSAVALIIVIMVHICAALWIEEKITAMVEGRVTSDWAKKHHPRWYRAVRARHPKPQEKRP